jgi:hypothetical protein
MSSVLAAAAVDASCEKLLVMLMLMLMLVSVLMNAPLAVAAAAVDDKTALPPVFCYAGAADD